MRRVLASVVLVGALVSAWSPPASAQSPKFTIEPYYVFPADQRYHAEYEQALREHVRQVRRWYRDKVGRNFQLEKLRVVQSREDYSTMRCGPSPTSECLVDRQQLPFWVGSVVDAVGGLNEQTGKWIFAQGGGGFAGANLLGNYLGYALAGDWTLEPISGVVEPDAITCAFSDGWQCAIDADGNGAPYGTGPHELGHIFGLHHPDGYDGTSLMKWHGDYPSTDLLPHEVMILRETPWFTNHAFDPGAPFLYFENRDVAHWGEFIFLGGTGFQPGDELEFRDVFHSVRVVANVVSPSLLEVTVPFGLGPGYIRVWRGGLRSNVVPINLYP